MGYVRWKDATPLQKANAMVHLQLLNIFLPLVIVILAIVLLLSGCGVDLPINQQLDASSSDLEEPLDLQLIEMTLLRLPLGHEHLLEGWIVGVDHDPVDHGGLGMECVNHDGYLNFPYCYDEHRGTDFALAGGFLAMDEGVGVLAAADGTVIRVVDGNYDRCRLDWFEVTCDGHPMEANEVVIQHPDGLMTIYKHLRKDSVVVEPGDEVACGALIGMVGSSGNSVMPHLHLELRMRGEVVDPYSGHWSQPWSWWATEESWTGFPGELCQ